MFVRVFSSIVVLYGIIERDTGIAAINSVVGTFWNDGSWVPTHLVVNIYLLVHQACPLVFVVRNTSSNEDDGTRLPHLQASTFLVQDPALRSGPHNVELVGK